MNIFNNELIPRSVETNYSCEKLEEVGREFEGESKIRLPHDYFPLF